jgi:hypothetical protein
MTQALAELEATFDHCEYALTSNTLAVPAALFWRNSANPRAEPVPHEATSALDTCGAKQ